MLGVILAAGAATRLRPLSVHRPKTLMPVLDVPLLKRCIASMRVAGITDIRVNAHEWAQWIREEADRAEQDLGVHVVVSEESDRRLGTGRALLEFRDDLSETFILHNGDIATTLDVGELLNAHRSSGGWGTLVVVPHSTSADLFAEEGWVTSWARGPQRSEPGLRWSGVAAFEPEVLRYISEEPCGLFETVLEGVIRDRKGLAALAWEGYWTDVGTPRAYLEANLDALAGALGDPPSRNHVGEDAVTEGSALRHTVIGSGAKLAPGSDLERCVVWDGVSVQRGSYRDSVLTQAGAVRVH